MPTKHNRKLIPVGKETKQGDRSALVTLPKGFVNWITKLTKNDEAPITIYGNSILILKPDAIPLDKEGVIKLLNQIEKIEEGK